MSVVIVVVVIVVVVVVVVVVLCACVKVLVCASWCSYFCGGQTSACGGLCLCCESAPYQ